MNINVEMTSEENNIVTPEFVTQALKEHMKNGHGISDVSISINENKIKVNIVEKNGNFNVMVGDVNFGDFERLPDSDYSYYPKLQHKLTGDHFIAIGEALNKFNKEYNSKYWK
jgi:hypothetical protein